MDDSRIIFQSEHWIAYNKPSGWLSVPGRQGINDPRPVVGLAMEAALKKRVWPIHRLDCEVSGLILFALTAKAHREANIWFSSQLIQKSYEAWTPCLTKEDLSLIGKSQEWSSLLVRGKKRVFAATYGKPAKTLAIAQDQFTWNEKPLQRWSLQPLTGRSHQLRYELATRGYPIVGDSLYGSSLEFFPHALALRSVRIDFTRCQNASELGLPSFLCALDLENEVSANL